MDKCSFCGGPIKPATGKMFVRHDGKVLYFCRPKCEKNHNMGRVGKETKWTELYMKGDTASKRKRKKK